MFLNETFDDDFTQSLALMEAYDQTYDIFDHDRYAESDPLSIIGMHPAEDFITGSRLQMVSREIMACRLPELTNTPLLELMQYPRWYLDDLLKEGRKNRKKEERIQEQLDLQLSQPPPKA